MDIRTRPAGFEWKYEPDPRVLFSLRPAGIKKAGFWWVGSLMCMWTCMRTCFVRLCGGSSAGGDFFWWRGAGPDTHIYILFEIVVMYFTAEEQLAKPKQWCRSACRPDCIEQQCHTSRQHVSVCEQLCQGEPLAAEFEQCCV